jgi:hypothetical protein
MLISFRYGANHALFDLCFVDFMIRGLISRDAALRMLMYRCSQFNEVKTQETLLGLTNLGLRFSAHHIQILSGMIMYLCMYNKRAHHRFINRLPIKIGA